MVNKIDNPSSDRKENLDQPLKLIAKTSLIVLIGLFISKLLTYVYRIIVARYFGPEEYGLFSLSLMVVGFLVAVSALGLTDGLLRYIPIYRGTKEKEKINYIFKISLFIVTISSIFSGFLLFFTSNFISVKIFHNAGLIPYLKWFSLLIPITILANLFLTLLRSYEKIKWYSFIQNIAQNIMKVLFLALFILLGLKTNAIIFSYLLGILSMLILSYLVWKYTLTDFFTKTELKYEEKKEARKLLISYSWPIIFIGFVGTVIYWIDSFVIGYFKTATDVGFYNAALPIAGLFNMASEIFLQLLFPLITKEYSKNNKELVKDLSQQVGKWIFIINLPLLVLLLIFPVEIITLIFGKNYAVAATALRILAISSIFTSISVLSSNLLLMAGKTRLILINAIIFTIINLVLNLILVPRYGINGAAIATTLSTIVLSSIYFFLSYKYTSILPFKRKMLRILLVSSILGFLVVIMRKFLVINLISFIFISILFCLFYIVLLFLTKCLDEHDLVVLKSARNKILISLRPSNKNEKS